MEFIEIINSIGGANFSGFVLFLKILSAVISIAFIIGSIYSWIEIQKISEAQAQSREEHFSRSQKKKDTKSNLNNDHWNHVKGMFQSPDSTAWRMAVIDADAMLEDLITDLGFQEGNFGDKLKAMQQAGVPWVQSAWDVHLLRNRLAHEGSKYPLNNREAYQAFKVYESIFQNTGYLA
jgi:uncharacterized membrane protein